MLTDDRQTNDDGKRHEAFTSYKFSKLETFVVLLQICISNVER